LRNAFTLTAVSFIIAIQFLGLQWRDDGQEL
jgi:hypothetical protein